jgi:hypothetical protein
MNNNLEYINESLNLSNLKTLVTKKYDQVVDKESDEDVKKLMSDSVVKKIVFATVFAVLSAYVFTKTSYPEKIKGEIEKALKEALDRVTVKIIDRAVEMGLVERKKGFFRKYIGVIMSMYVTRILVSLKIDPYELGYKLGTVIGGSVRGGK